MRQLRSLLAPLLLLLIVLLIGRAFHLYTDPDRLPGWDGSGYVLRGIRFSDAIKEGNFSELARMIVRPDIRPPAFAMMLGSYMLVRGNDIATGIEWAQLTFFLSLLCLPLLGWQSAGRRGALAGLAAAVLTAGGSDHLALLFYPMSESTTLLVTLGVTALGLACATQGGARAQLLLGAGLLFSALMRYNLVVFLLAPLLANHVWERLGRPLPSPTQRPLLDPRLLLWGLPTLLVFGLWQLTQPALAERIQTFMVNRSSGLPFWSAANLLFVPHTVESAFLGTWFAAAPVIALFLIGCLPLFLRRALRWERGAFSLVIDSSAPLRLLQFHVLAVAAALTLHDYKLERNFYGSIPLLYLCAFLPFVQSRVRFGAAALAAGLSGWTVWRLVVGVPAITDRYHMEVDRGVIQALDFIAAQAAERPRVWITGTNDAISPPLLELWFYKAGLNVKLKTEAPPMHEKTRTGIDASWTEAYARYVAEEMLVDKERGRTTYITIETIPGSRRFRGGQKWTNYQNNYATALKAQTEIPQVGELKLDASGLWLHAFRGEAAATRAAKPAPEVTAGDVVFRADFSRPGEAWIVQPAAMARMAAVEIKDDRMEVRVGAPQAQLQVCGPDIRLPQPSLVGRAEVETEGLTGRPVVFQLRGLDEAGTLVKDQDGKGDIHRMGPLKGDGAQQPTAALSFQAGSVKVRPCLILNNASGTVRIDSFGLYLPTAE